jgi:hypothetical protein
MLYAVFGRTKFRAGLTLALGALAMAIPSMAGAANNVTLAWDPSTDPNVSGYHLYYGPASRNYTNMIDFGTANTGTVSNLAAATTYYFAATTYDSVGLESAYSVEVSYTVSPPNQPPKLDPINNLTINENSGQLTVSLTGISSGASNEVQTLTVTAFSSAPSLIPNPTVNYTSPSTTGSLNFTPVTNSFGSATLTVMVDDGGAVSNTVIRSFNVTVVPPLATNATVLPNSLFRFVINPPITNRDHLTYSLDPGAPDGATVTTRKGVSALVWAPDSTQASTTNLIKIRITDNTNPALTTTETVQVIVLDYLNVALGWTAVQAGQKVLVPVALTSSDGVTNLSFSLLWPTNRFSSPVLTNALAAIGSSSLQRQTTNLLITVQAAAGKVIQGTNNLIQLSFQAFTTQPSAFVPLPFVSISATKSNGLPYADCTAQAGRVVVVKDAPLLESFQSANAARWLALYGQVGTNYQVQYSINPILNPSWQALTTYTQTNTAQTLAVGSSPVIFYRLLQR